MLYFILYIFLEVMVSSSISSSIGGLMTFFELFGSAILGLTLLKNFQFSLMEKFMSVKNHELTQEEFIKSSIGSAIGAILLIIPGFFTDILGALLQFTFFTILLTKILKLNNIKNNKSNYFKSDFRYNNKKQKGDDNVIDVEIINDNSSLR
jgi:2-isopropylmalate synthase/UPF0716 protein FxsA